MLWVKVQNVLWKLPREPVHIRVHVRVQMSYMYICRVYMYNGVLCVNALKLVIVSQRALWGVYSGVQGVRIEIWAGPLQPPHVHYVLIGDHWDTKVYGTLHGGKLIECNATICMCIRVLIVWCTCTCTWCMFTGNADSAFERTHSPWQHD